MDNPDNSNLILLYTIIGDTLGSPFDGLSRGHLYSHFKTIDNYCDTTSALKGKMELWKKPGLYSSISQLMLLLHFANFNIKQLKDIINQNKEYFQPYNDEHETILRYYNSMEADFLSMIISNDTLLPSTSYTATARCIPVLTPLALINNSPLTVYNTTIKWSTCFTLHSDTISGSLLFTGLLHKLYNTNFHAQSILEATLKTVQDLIFFVENNPSIIFENKINPDRLTDSLQSYATIINTIQPISDIAKAEKTIYEHANNFLKTPITRATVDNPGVLFPYVIYLIKHYQNDLNNILYHTAKLGGATAAMCSITGALIASLAEKPVLQDVLTDNLINKKKLLNYINLPVRQKRSKILVREFLQGELSLTKKYLSELQAKLKHVPQKTKKKKPVNKDSELSRHIVNSWTKLDKAKWKKARKKMNNV